MIRRRLTPLGLVIAMLLVILGGALLASVIATTWLGFTLSFWHAVYIVSPTAVLSYAVLA